MRVLNLIFLPLAASLSVLHLADFHLDVDYSTSGDNTKLCHNATNGTRMHLGKFGDYMCDSPQSLVEFSVSEAQRLFPYPDVVLWTGDNVPHIEEYDTDYVVNAIKITTNAIFNRFPHVKYILPTFGNHDYAPANGFEDSSDLYVKTWDMWSSVIDPSQKENFLRGGYYKTNIGGENVKNATVLVLNTNLYYNANKAYDNFTDKIDPAGMFSFMETELQNAEMCSDSNCNTIVHVVAHIPPGMFEKSPNFKWFRDEYNEKFINITVRYQKTIKWMFYGHHHTDTFHLVKDSNGTTVQLSLMAPAVTPWFSSLPGAGANNPAFRVYDINNSTHDILDIRTFYVNLTSLNNDASTQFVPEYSFAKDYGISPVTPAAMDELLQTMKNNDSVFQKYIIFNSIMWDTALPEGEFRGAQLCSIEFSDYPRYYECMKEYTQSSGVFRIILSIVFPFIVFF